MKKNRVLILILSILSVFLLCSCKKKTTTTTKKTTIPTSITTNAPTVKPSSNTNTTKPVSTESGDVKSYELYSGNYYDSVTSEMLQDSAALKAELNRIVNNGYVRKTYEQDYSLLLSIDMYDGHYIECIYTGVKYIAERNGVWDREHVWAKAYGFKDESYDAYSDLQHLRVAEHKINDHRSSSYFTEVEEPTSSDEYGNKWTSTSFEPRNEVKGDIARMLIYMTVKYDDGNVLDLELTDDVSLISASASLFGGLKPDTTGMSDSKKTEIDKRTYTQEPVYLGLLSMLLKWSIEDPVDEREIVRNNNVYAVQNNRNPFIDHPEYVYYIYKTQYESMNIEYDANNYNYYMVSNKEAIGQIDGQIDALPETITIDNKDVIEAIRTQYESLGQITKSFVDKYYVFVDRELQLDVLLGQLNIDKTIPAKFDFTSETLKTNTLFTNSIELKYTSGANCNSYGISSQVSKHDLTASKPTQEKINYIATFEVKHIYDTITALKICWDANNSAYTAHVVATDESGNKKEADLAFKQGSKGYAGDIVYLDLTGLNFEDVITITVTHNLRSAVNPDLVYTANTIRIRYIEFVLSIPN